VCLSVFALDASAELAIALQFVRPARQSVDTVKKAFYLRNSFLSYTVSISQGKVVDFIKKIEIIVQNLCFA